MSETDPEKSENPDVKVTSLFSPDFTTQLAELLRQMGSVQSTANNQIPQPENLGDLTIKPKLDGGNYPLWVNLMERGIKGRGLGAHIDGVTEAPSNTDPAYQRWYTRDNTVFNWVINNIEAELVNEVSQYETARDLWEALAVTYGSGKDPFQIYELHRQTNIIKQEGLTLEGLWQKFQNLWISIDRLEPNPMGGESSTAIEKYNKIVQTQRLYQFITALDDRFDAVKKEIIRKDPLPTVWDVLLSASSAEKQLTSIS